MVEANENAVARPFEWTALWDWDLRHNQLVWGVRSKLWSALGQEAPTSRADFLARLDPRDAQDLEREQRRALEEGNPRWDRRVHVQQGGHKIRERAFVVRDDQGPRRIVGSVEYVPPRRRTARKPTLGERLETSEERFQKFVECIPQLAWQATADGWIYFYNQRWYDYTHTTIEEMEGWGWVTVHDPDDLPRMLKVFRRALETGEPWEDEFRLRRGSDGMLRWHLSRAMPLRAPDGRIIHWFGTNTDIHDQKMALQERSALLVREREARRQAEDANRAKDEFLAVVSHELRTPLNAILGWAQLLVSGSLPADKQVEASQRIASSAQLQAKLIEDLLDVSRIIGGKLEIEIQPVDLAVVVQSSVDALRSSAERQQVELVVPDELPALPVQGSASRLQQVISNLLDNAIKFSEAGQRVEVSLKRDGSDAVIEVVDYGEGIVPEYLPRIFERFGQADSTTRRRRGGLGLGLSIARHLVELHHGTITVHSDGSGHGSRFTVRLPRKGSTGEVAAIVEDAVTSLHGLDILAVDDDDTARDVVGAILLARGATVTVVGSAAEALSRLRTSLPDAVVSDLGMPLVDGYDFAGRIRMHDDPRIRALPLIALTAYASAADRNRALGSGFDAYVAKPIDADELVRIIATTIKARAVG